ncbi:nitrate- and nitrite sensing domain-containing protein [Kitasatospora sp. SUK 42]|uniref:nitrate- and nitrite sensing domain-containing protein n=1 Tax=Kitasatospora sp. SUK 42 TaxID=1588882 RepID=UPI0018C959DA|nr:nitrate- and nitrite sensing domain-containing protein [Kitasatospora sp. SUK 42]MBV2156298.1 nitrate- and nitrite sensing domain-containing protein [Kitasatospora sp. SUK 42]
MREDRGTAPGARRGAHAGPPARTPRPGPWLRGLRPRTVRARIIALLMVPVVSVIALWSFATVTTAQGVWELLRLRDTQRTLLTPVAGTVAGLQAERAAAGQLLAAPSTAPGAAPGAATGAARESALRDAAATTDRALAPLFPDPRHPGQGYNRADAEGLGADAATRLDALAASLAALPDLRAKVLARSVSWPDAYAAYGAAVERALAVSGAVAPSQGHGAAADARVLQELARSRELLAREDALLCAARLSGAFGDDQLREFDGLAFARREFEQGATADLGAADRAALLAVTGGQDHRDLVGYEERVRGAADGRTAIAAVPEDRWELVAGNVAGGLRAVEDQAGRVAAERHDPYALGLFTSAGIAVLLGLLGVIASLVISVQIGRGLVTELIGLRNSALDLAGRELPATIRKVRAGEEVDIEAEAPRPVGRDDEIGQVHRALGTVRRAAVTAAVERAEVLSGVSGVFVNLARRSQVLLHRQLTLLDAMERRTEDPSELADLFRLDHLTTRMRRHAEGLIILSGAVPGRAWRRPVPLVDVVRAAVSEVEEYARAEVHPLPRAAVVGHAVADLTHLVAELVENATGFSPPHTRVHIRGERVGNGYALEIEDRGLGMGPAALLAANRRITAAEQTDLFDSDRLGLFVVSRLARRHDVKVSLVTSAYGGTTAVVLLPTELLADEGDGQAHHAGPVAELDVVTAESGPAPRVWAGALTAWPGPVLPDGGTTGIELPAAGGPLPEGGALPPPGIRGGDPGPARRSPFRASGARTAGPAADGGAGAAARPQAGPPQPRPQLDDPPQSRRTATAPVPAEERPGPGDPRVAFSQLGDGPEQLPRRVRQAGLVAQLREAPAGTDPRTRRTSVAGADTAPAGRSPEAARAAMSAFQSGWARGLRPDQRSEEPPFDAAPPRPPRHHPSSSRTEGERP